MQRVHFVETSRCRISPTGQPHQRTRPQVLIFNEKGITNTTGKFPIRNISQQRSDIFKIGFSFIQVNLSHPAALPRPWHPLYFGISALLAMKDMNDLCLWNHHTQEHEGNTQLLLRTRHQHTTCWPKAFALESTCLLLWNQCFSHPLIFKTIA